CSETKRRSRGLRYLFSGASCWRSNVLPASGRQLVRSRIVSLCRQHAKRRQGLAVILSWSTLIVGRSRGGLDVNPFARFVELDLAVDQREQGPVAACADVLAGDEFGAALADQDAARGDKFAAEPFYAESFADAVAPV